MASLPELRAQCRSNRGKSDKSTVSTVLHLEHLEERLVPYALSGNAWPNPELITISFVPDGTPLTSAVGTTVTSNLFSTFNAKFGSQAAWQNQILKAAQVWAQQTNINFNVVTDSGASTGSGSYQQGDPSFGDIRIGGYNFGSSTLAQAYMPPSVNNYSIAGDIAFNTGQTFNVGSTYDLFTVAMHEFGHVLGLYHTATSKTAMYATYSSAMSALAADDIAGIRAVYSDGAARVNDAFDAAAVNNTVSTATNISSRIGSTTKAGVINDLDLTTATDVDWYKFVVPSGSSSTLKVKVQSQGLSLLNPKVDIYASNGTTLKASANSSSYGGIETATITGIAPGQTYTIKVSSADAVTAFKTGKYALIVNMGTGGDPQPTLPDTRVLAGSPQTAGGGQAMVLNYETQANTYSNGIQQTAESRRALATNADGSYVVAWSSEGQDGSGWGVYARMYDANGVPKGNEFRVNSTTYGDQKDVAVATSSAGMVITWSSYGQDGNGWGIYGQRYNVAGVPQGGEFRINGTTHGDQFGSAVAMDALGDFAVTWTSANQDGSGLGVYARTYNLLALLPSAEVRVSTTTTGDQTHASIVMDQLTSDFIVTWASNDQNGTGWNVYARQFTLLGLPLLLPFRINATTVGDQTDPAIVLDRTGTSFVVTWSSHGQDGSGWGIYGRRYTLLGLIPGNEFQVNTTTNGDQTGSSVAMDAGGNLLITWSSSGQDGSGQGIYAQQFMANGGRLEDEFSVNSTTVGDQTEASVAISPLGQAIIAWSGAGENDTQGVFFQRYSLLLDFYGTEEHDHGPAESDHEKGHVRQDSTQDFTGGLHLNDLPFWLDSSLILDGILPASAGEGFLQASFDVAATLTLLDFGSRQDDEYPGLLDGMASVKDTAPTDDLLHRICHDLRPYRFSRFV